MGFVPSKWRASGAPSPASQAAGEADIPGGAHPKPGRWLPTTRLRDVLFLALLAGAVLLFGNFAVVRTIMEPRTALIGLTLAAEIGAIHDAAQALPPQQRLPWVKELVLASRDGLALASQGPGVMHPPSRPMEADTMEVIHRQLPGMEIGLVEGSPSHVWFAVPGEDGEPIWLKFQGVTMTERAGMLVAAWGSGGVVFVIAALVAIGWRQQRRVQGAAEALARIEGPSLSGGLAPVSVAAAPAAAVPPALAADLPDARSLEELVRVMSGRMERMDSQREEVMEAVAREVRLALADAPAGVVPVAQRAAFERVASQFEAFASAPAMAAQPVRPADLNVLVERATQQAPVGVTLGLAPLPPLDLRPDAMACLLDNLLRNALSHGGGQAVLTTAEEGDEVVLRVMDRGDPLADDELAMIGRPFYRTSDARAKGIGAGLGLALARHIAQSHGGELRFARREGGGLAVEVRLPIPQEESPPARWLAPRRRPLPAWWGLLGDMALLAVLYLGALLLGLSLLSRVVMEPNMHASGVVWVRLLGGITGAYVTLPTQARPAYLEALERHSGGRVHLADPSNYRIAQPLLPGPRAGLEFMQRAMPDLEIAATPIPNSSLWVRLPPVDGGPPGPWLRFSTPQYSRDIAVVVTGLVLLVVATAAFLAVRVRRRLDWAAQAMGGGHEGLEAQARAHGESQAMADRLDAVRERFVSVCLRLAHARTEQERLLAHLSQDLHEAIDRLQPPDAPPSALRACADRLRCAIEGMDRLAQPRDGGGEGGAHVNQLLSMLPVDPALVARHPIRWSLGGVPLADVEDDEARRIFGSILLFLQAQAHDGLEVSSAFENGWVVVRFTQQGGHTDPGTATQALLLTCQRVESHGGFMRFGQAPGRPGVQVEVLLQPVQAM